MKRLFLVLLVWSTTIGGSHHLLAQEISIAHDGVACVAAGKYPQMDARLDPAAGVSRARIFFRPDGTTHWYFVAMRTDTGVFRGVLPKPRKTLKRFTYYIEATGTDFGTTRTAEYTPEVVSGPGACRDRVLAAALPLASVVVGGPAGAPPVPVGFETEGLVVAGSAGAAVASVAASGGAASGSGVGSTLLALGVAGAAAGGLALADPSLTRSDDNSTGPVVDCSNLPPGPSTLAIVVSPGTQPDFNWAPSCPVADVLVELASDGSDVGGAQGQAPFIPPVRYQGSPLRPGVAYRVVLFAANEQVVGGQVFIP